MGVHVAQTYGYGTRGSRIGLLAPNPYQRRNGKTTTGGTAWTSPLDFARDRRDLPCRQPKKANWWFAPEQHNHTTEADRDTAVALCQGCPVLLQCRRYALGNTSIRDGVWGGLILAGMPSATRTRLLTQTRRQLKETT
jgi:hypothetical protein